MKQPITAGEVERVIEELERIEFQLSKFEASRRWCGICAQQVHPRKPRSNHKSTCPINKLRCFLQALLVEKEAHEKG